MKLNLQLMAAIAGLCFFAFAQADNATDKISRVKGFPDRICVPSARGDGEGVFWNLKLKSEFDFRKDGVDRYNLSPITMGIDKEIEDPDFFHVNYASEFAEYPPCSGQSLKDRQLFFAIHNIHEHGHEDSESWHALIYVPVEHEPGKFDFYLIVLSIANDTTSCDDLQDEPRKKQCQAIRKLAAMKMDGKPQQEIRDEFNDRIDVILPKSGFVYAKRAEDDRPAIRYHNGVIHGSF